MKRIILALFIGLLPYALHAQTAATSSTVIVQDKSTSPQATELQEAERLSASVQQLYAAGNYKEALPQARRGNNFKKPQPRYPREALSARIQGSVLVLAETDETGKVVSVEPVPCWGGQKLLADAAAEARETLQSKIDQFKATAARYESEPDPQAPNDPLRGEGKRELAARAADFAAQRDRAQLQDPNFDFSEALFQIAIVLASVSILATSRLIMKVSVAVGIVATVLMLNGYFLFFKLPF
jgi:hypothetical protein